MTKLVSRFLKDESGATAIEYGLIAALISVAIITGASALGTKLGNMFTNLSNTINTNTPK
jgi:pilus assembly protein Flp/PilA